MTEASTKPSDSIRSSASMLPEVPLISPELFYTLAALPRAWFQPLFFGLDNIVPGQGCLFVANHTLYGGVDVPLYMAEVYKRTGILMRPLVDKFQYTIPGWRDVMSRIGGVEGTRDGCSALMRAHQSPLVFPGGAREVFKRRGEAYKLLWKQRTGFVRLAIQHGYPMIPVASVGCDHAFSILVDGNDIERSLLGRLMARTGIARTLFRNGDIYPTLARGIGPSPLPRPERFYFSFGKPIPTDAYRGQFEDKAVQLEVRQQVADALEAQIAQLLQVRERDPETSGLIRRVLKRL